MKNKDMRAMCVYAGPEIMAKMHGGTSDPDKRIESAVRCPRCGANTSDEALFCAACGAPLKAPEQPAPIPRDLQQNMAVATYAGPDFYNNGMPAGIQVAPVPYPMNYQTNDEEPLELYAGPPLDGFDE